MFRTILTSNAKNKDLSLKTILNLERDHTGAEEKTGMQEHAGKVIGIYSNLVACLITVAFFWKCRYEK